MKSIFNSKNLLIICCIFIFIINYISSIKAEGLEASNYQIYLNLNNPEYITSENIIIERKISDDNTENLIENVYLDRFKLTQTVGEEILPEYIVVETPFAKSTLAEQHRFLIMKKDQKKSWFKITILSEAAYSFPGDYKADLYINELDWNISLNLKVEPFVKFNLSDNNFSINIENPSNTRFYISSELYEFNIDSNHNDWKVTAFLDSGGLFTEKGDYLSAEKVFYYFENDERKINNLNLLTKEQFNNFNETESISLITGADYNRNLKYIRFAVYIGENWSSQTAGLYKGTIVFTIIADN